MNMKKEEREKQRHKKRWAMFFGNLLIRLLVIAIFAIFAAVKLIHQNTILWVVLLLYLGCYDCFARLYGGFKSGNYRISEICTAQMLSLIFANGCGWAACSIFKHHILSIMPFFVIFLVQLVLIIFWAWAMNKLYFTMNIPRKVVVVSDADAAILLKKLRKRALKFDVAECLNGKKACEQINRICQNFDGVILYETERQYREEIIAVCAEKELRVFLVPELSDIRMRSMRMMHILDTPLLMYEEFKLHKRELLIKRLCDILLSASALLLTSPLFFIIAVAIKIEDKGPVFFFQERCTKNLRIFKMVKFRSMKPGSDKLGPIPATEMDSRITRVGKVIRAMRLDELPQLWNILTGDMSIVGPRPERVEYVKAYTKELPEFALRSRMQGGLTGYAQVYGKYNTSPYDKLVMDLNYIENWSLLLDVKLILLTIKVCLKKESTEGFEEETAASLAKQASQRK